MLRTAASAESNLSVMAAMASASVMMTPSNPSSPRSFSVRIMRESVDGTSEPVTFGRAICAVMMRSAPARMPSQKGSISHFSSSSQVFWVLAEPLWVSVFVSP